MSAIGSRISSAPFNGGTIVDPLIFTNAGTKTTPAIGWVGSSAGIFRAGNQVRFTSAGTDWVAVDTTGLLIRSAAAVGWGSAGPGDTVMDVGLHRDAQNILALRTTFDTDHTFRIYSEWTDSSNYSRLTFITVAGDFTIKTEAAGTGTLRDVNVEVGSLLVTNAAEGAVGSANVVTAREVVALTSGSTVVTTIAIPSGARLLGVALNVDTAITNAGDDTWSAAFSGGSTTTVAAGSTSPAQNTKISILLPDEIVSSETEITFTPQGADFTAGAIEVVVWYETLTPLANA